MLYCEICGENYDRPRKSKRRTCSRSCAVALSWQNEATKAKRIASNIATHNTPQLRRKHVQINKERWAMPGHRENLAELNRRRWADPAFKEQTSATIRGSWTPEMREALGQIKRGKPKPQKKPKPRTTRSTHADGP